MARIAAAQVKDGTSARPADQAGLQTAQTRTLAADPTRIPVLYHRLGGAADLEGYPGGSSGFMAAAVVSSVGFFVAEGAVIEALAWEGSRWGARFGLAALGVGLTFALGAWRRLRFLLVRRAQGKPLPEMKRLRLTGHIEAAEGSGDDPTLLLATRFAPRDAQARARGGLKEEVRGRPLLLRLDDGRALALDPACIELVEGFAARAALDKPHYEVLRPVRRRPRIQQARLAEGDRVEVIGRIKTEVARAGIAAPGRGTPLRTAIVPAGGDTVLVRRIK